MIIVDIIILLLSFLGYRKNIDRSTVKALWFFHIKKINSYRFVRKRQDLGKKNLVSRRNHDKF